jgi:hypothetical protein
VVASEVGLVLPRIGTAPDCLAELPGELQTESFCPLKTLLFSYLSSLTQP